MSTTLYAGVDVSKGRLDIALRPTGECFTVPNDDAGIDSLVGRLQRARRRRRRRRRRCPALVVVEASGGFERPVAAALAVAAIPVAVVNPRQARDFA